jgi:hypothetical protein
MRIFALETDIEKIKNRFVCEGEKVKHITHYHGASFFFASIREILVTLLLLITGVVAWFFNAPMGFTVIVLVLIWIFFVLFSGLKAYIDWCYDLVIVTTDKIILVDQTSIFKQKVNPIHIENIGSVTSLTQFWDIFSFGIVEINLKEGEGGGKIVLHYVPEARDVAAHITDAVTHYQRWEGRAPQRPREDVSAEA